MSITYSAVFSAVAVAAAQDVFELVASADVRVAIKSIAIGQYSDAGDAEAEMLSLLVMRGHTTSGSGGSSVTPTPFNSYLRAAETTAEANNTTVATAGSPVTIISDSFNVQAGYFWEAADLKPDGDDGDMIILKPSERLVVRITAPADAVTMNGTIVFEERAKAPVS